MPRGAKALRTAAYWLLPALVGVLLHWDGLRSWFQADDFAWLGAATEIDSLKRLWEALMRPAAQGTLRPLSERLFFFTFWHAFGWNALPYRGFVLLNMCGNLVLLARIMRRVSPGAVAGFVAPLVWIVNSALVVPMAWTSAYNEVLCATFLLSALLLWMRFVETGRVLFYLLQAVVFVAGFGALELNIVYPALAALHALLFGRRYVVWSVPLFAIAAGYYKLHTALAPLLTSGLYQPHFDFGVLQTFEQFWKLCFVPPYGFSTALPWLTMGLLVVASAGAILFLGSEVRRGRYAALFFAGWFLVTLAPLVPFGDHVTHYYLTVPLAGLAALAALAFARYPWWAGAVLALYFVIQVPTLREGERWYRTRSLSSRALVMGVRQVHAWEPAKTILLTDVSPDLYGYTLADTPFRLIPGALVYLAPEEARRIVSLPENLTPVRNFVLEAGPVRRALLEGGMVVYSAAGFPLREVTADYTARVLIAPEPGLPRRVDAGSSLMQYLLGPEWYPAEGPYRWMAKWATLRMPGPRAREEKLYLNGFATPEQLEQPGARVNVSVDGVPTGGFQLSPADATFTRAVRLPPASVGKAEVTVRVDVDRTFRGDGGRGRELGLVFGIFEIR